MLIALRRPAFALFVPVSFVAFGALASVACVDRMVATPSFGNLFALLLALVLCGFVLSLVRVMWRSGDTLVVRGLFSRSALVASGTAFGFTLRARSRSQDYPIEASDGTRTVECFSVWSRFGAKRCVAKLARIAGDPESAVHVRAQQRLDRLRTQSDAAHTKAHADVMAYYRTPAWRRTVLVLVGFVAVYAIGMSIFVATR